MLTKNNPPLKAKVIKTLKAPSNLTGRLKTKKAL